MTDNISEDHNQTDFARLIRDVRKAVKLFRESRSRSTRSLYQALEKVHHIRKRAADEPEKFLEYAKQVYQANSWGRITTATTRNPYTIPIRLTFGNEEDEQPTVARYAKALLHLEETTPAIDPSEGGLINLLESSGGIEALVADARRKTKQNAGEDETLPMAFYQETLLRKEANQRIVIADKKGFRLLLVHVGEDGQPKILSEGSEDEVNEAVRKAASERFAKFTPVPGIGNAHACLRVLDPWLPTDIDEYREPCVNDGLVFLFLRKGNAGADIRYWINSEAGDLYRFWLQIQTDPEPLLAMATKIMVQTKENDRTYVTKSELLPQRLGSDTLLASAAFLVTRLWSSRRKTSAASLANELPRAIEPDLFARIRKIHPLLDGVKITNLPCADVLTVPPSGKFSDRQVFVFIDPSNLNQASPNQERRDEPGATDESRRTAVLGNSSVHHESYTHLLQNAVNCPYRWLMTHGSKMILSPREIGKGIKIAAGAEFFEYDIPATFRTRNTGESLICNFSQEQQWHQWRQITLPGEVVKSDGPGKPDGHGYRSLFQ
ncbi:MAG: hypothetical protein HQL37_02775 [Alphaproteobacteria bacterium]|nr:hypothetical protein [Alphaproteobacteria bacterium]